MTHLIQLDSTTFPITPRMLLDEAGTSHVIAIGETILLDGEPAKIVGISQEIRLRSAASVHVFAASSFWQAFAGGNATATDAGMFLAQCLARWSVQQQLAQSLHILQTEALAWREVLLPQYRFDEFTQRTLDAYDGTEETTRVLARLLDQSPETIQVWACQVGKTIPTHAVDPVLNGHEQHQEMVTAPDAHEAENPTAGTNAPLSSGTAHRFPWTAERIEQLTADFLASTAENIQASIREIATRYDWPLGAVQGKVYDLKLPSQKRGAAHQRESQTLQEGD